MVNLSKNNKIPIKEERPKHTISFFELCKILEKQKEENESNEDKHIEIPDKK